MSDQDQVQQVPLIEQLRNVPLDHRTQWVIQQSEDGAPTGYALCPIGRLCHVAADRIAELEKIEEKVRSLIRYLHAEELTSVEAVLHELSLMYPLSEQSK